MTRRSISMSHIFFMLLLLMDAEAHLFEKLSNDRAIRQSLIADDDFIFSMVALEATLIDAEGRPESLQAFRGKENDQILLHTPSNPHSASQLRFKSIGYPTIVPPPPYVVVTESWEIPAFVPSSNGFKFFVQMLTQTHKEVLARVANEHYHTTVSIKPTQISTLYLDSFTCDLVFTRSNHLTVTLLGKVKTLDAELLQVYVVLAESSPLYKELRSGQITSHNVEINCVINKGALHAVTDRLIITTEQIDQLEMKAKLFGNAEEVFVSRQQLNALGRDVMQKLNIYESYESEGSFDASFITDFLSNFGVQKAFTPIPIADVLKLSPYNFSSDLSPNTIKKDYSDVLKIENTGSKEHIIKNRNSQQLTKESSIDSGDTSISGSAGAFSASVAANYASSKLSEWESNGKSLDDELSEINNNSLSAVKYGFEGTKIVPKSLDVAQISKSKLSNSMTCSKISRKLVTAIFHKEFQLTLPRTEAELMATTQSKKNRCPGWLYKKCEESTDCCQWDHSGFKLTQSCGEIQPNRTFCNCVAPGDQCYGGFRCCDGSVCDAACPLAGKFHYCHTEVTPNCQWGLTCTEDPISKLIWPSEFEGRGRCLPMVSG